MIKKSICLVSAILAVFISLLVLSYLSYAQGKPFGTNNEFEFNARVVLFVRYTQVIALAFVVLVISVLYGFGNLSAYLICVKQTFHKISHRYY